MVFAKERDTTIPLLFYRRFVTDGMHVHNRPKKDGKPGQSRVFFNEVSIDELVRNGYYKKLVKNGQSELKAVNSNILELPYIMQNLGDVESTTLIKKMTLSMLEKCEQSYSDNIALGFSKGNTTFSSYVKMNPFIWKSGGGSRKSKIGIIPGGKRKAKTIKAKKIKKSDVSKLVDEVSKEESRETIDMVIGADGDDEEEEDDEVFEQEDELDN